MNQPGVYGLMTDQPPPPPPPPSLNVPRVLGGGRMCWCWCRGLQSRKSPTTQYLILGVEKLVQLISHIFCDRQVPSSISSLELFVSLSFFYSFYVYVSSLYNKKYFYIKKGIFNCLQLFVYPLRINCKIFHNFRISQSSRIKSITLW